MVKNSLFVSTYIEYVFARVKQSEEVKVIEADLNPKKIDLIKSIFPNQSQLKIEKGLPQPGKSNSITSRVRI